MILASIVLALLFVATVVLVVVGLVRKATPFKTLGVLFILVGLFELIGQVMGGVPDPELLQVGILWSLIYGSIGAVLFVIGLSLLVVGIQRGRRAFPTLLRRHRTQRRHESSDH
jgi:hypothetical protein